MVETQKRFHINSNSGPLTKYGEIESALENLDGCIADLEDFFWHVKYPLFGLSQSEAA